MSKPKETNAHPAGPDHQVVTLEGGSGTYRREPCAECPWRVENAEREFPPEAFRHSATTAYDGAMNSFACHESGKETPATCAGFLLNGSFHNMGVRIRQMTGALDLATVHDGGAVLFDDYRSMAEANGVDPDDPALGPCRGNGYDI